MKNGVQMLCCNRFCCFWVFTPLSKLFSTLLSKLFFTLLSKLLFTVLSKLLTLNICVIQINVASLLRRIKWRIVDG